jgi:1-deoxy-D-xylulose-5-phosphate reductoisomerase
VIGRFPDRFELLGVAAGSDVAGLTEVVERFGVRRAVVVSPPADRSLPAGMTGGLDAACELAAMDCDVVCVAIPGAAALRPTLAALDAGRTVATATK